MDYNSWIAVLRDSLQEKDSPLSLRNGHWEVADRKTLWHSIGSRIFDTHLNQFKVCAVETLREIDAQFDLPAENRYVARIHGKVLRHSSDLRQGLSETLALLGNFGNVLVNCPQHKANTIVVLSVREILEQATWQLWGSLNDLLPTLAEAAPDEFLSQVEHALQQTPCPFDNLFAEERSGITGRNYMTGLLWALESLSWSDKYLARVAIILAELASHDPGGQWANRPANSLVTILLPWYPQTLAPIDKRIASIKAVKADFPNVAWKALLAFLPNQHQTSVGAHRPRWHMTLPEDWKPRVSHKEYQDQVTAYAGFAVEMAQGSLDRLIELVRNLDNLPKTSFENLLEYLGSAAIVDLPESQRLPIWVSLMDFVTKHRKFSDAKWALKSELIDRINTAADKLTPTSLEGLYRRLFSKRDFSLYEEKGNWEEQRQKLDEKRQQAIREIFKATGLSGILEFVVNVESPNHVGWALGEIAENNIDVELLPSYLDADNDNYKQFTASFVSCRFYKHGWVWVDTIEKSKWSPVQRCQFLVSLPFSAETWHRVTAWLGTGENEYWKKVIVNPYQSEGDVLVAIDKLLEVSRPQAAIECLNYRLYKKMPLDRTRTIKSLLDAVSIRESALSMDTYYVTELIKALQGDSQTDANDLFRVEWAYLPLLNENSGAEPILLAKRLSTDPVFFCEVIRRLYLSTSAEGRAAKIDESDESKATIADNAWRLLNEWKRPPGLQDDGHFSVKDFESWFDSVKDLCKKSGHLAVALIHVGSVLFYCPADPHGLWIDKAAASALNARDNEDMRRGFSMEVYNSRGAHWVDLSGKSEYEIASEWRKKANAVEDVGFVRLAATLKKLAGSYEREAERIIAEHKPGEKTSQEETR